MLELDVALDDNYDESTETFGASKFFRVKLEHSLVSVSKWESVWEISFLHNEKMTQEQTISYLKMMILNDDVPPEVFRKLVENYIPTVNDYIAAKQTASTVPENPNTPKDREIITSELIYYWMIELGIPMEAQYWHLKRLLMLVRVVNFKKDPKATKMSVKDRRALNKARQKQFNTRG